MCVLFFFSSRRRHTRLQGDWSSDVCSSDLAPLAGSYKNVGNSFQLQLKVPKFFNKIKTQRNLATESSDRDYELSKPIIYYFSLKTM